MKTNNKIEASAPANKPAKVQQEERAILRADANGGFRSFFIRGSEVAVFSKRYADVNGAKADLDNWARDTHGPNVNVRWCKNDADTALATLCLIENGDLTLANLSIYARKMFIALLKLQIGHVEHDCGGFTTDDIEWRMGTAFSDVDKGIEELTAAKLIIYAGYDEEDAIGHCYSPRSY